MKKKIKGKMTNNTASSRSIRTENNAKALTKRNVSLSDRHVSLTTRKTALLKSEDVNPQISSGT